VDYSEFIGGSSGDRALAITGANDGSADVYVGGVSSSSDFPATAGAYQTALAGRASAIVVRLTPEGSIEFATYLGGVGYSEGFTQINGLVADSQGDIYTSGFTSSYQFPASAGAVQDFNVAAVNPELGGAIGFITEFEPTLSGTLFSTLYGGEHSVVPLPGFITEVDTMLPGPAGHLYAGGTGATNNPPLTLYDPDQLKNAGAGSTTYGFLLRFSQSPLTISTPTLLPLAVVNKPYSVNFEASGGTPPYTWAPIAESVPSSMTLTSDGMLSGTLSSADFGATIWQDSLFTLRVTDSAGHAAVKGFDMLFDLPMSISGSTEINEPPGKSFAVQYQVDGGSYSEQCKLGSGSLPPGVSVAWYPSVPSCNVEGTAQQTGTYPFTLMASDYLGQVVYSPNIKLVVKEATPPSGGGGGGGGGASAPLPLIFLILLMAISGTLRRRTKR
ncbi:MAG: putative Ig domain-containing protein, partial [Terriglobia bacterium]